MTKDELLELADRCEREEASFELECAIARAVGFYRPHPELWRPKIDTPKYASSLDAAVTLVPKPGSWEVSASGCATVTVLCGRFLVSDDIERHGTGRTPALALCAAALRARASLTDKE